MSQDEEPRRLGLSHDRKVGGVCGGIAEYLGLDPTVVRILFVLLLFFPFVPVLGSVFLYVVLWLIMPPAPAFAPQRPSSGGGLSGGVLFGGFLLLVGSLVLFQRLFAFLWPAWWTLNIGIFVWPVVLILVGALIMAAALRRRA